MRFIQTKWFYLFKNSVQNNSSLRNSSQRRRLKHEFPTFKPMMSNRHRRNTNASASPSPSASDQQQCPKRKPIVKKALTRCSSSTNNCIVQCSNNYQFANGNTSAKLLCKAGVWTVEGFENGDKPVCERKYIRLEMYFPRFDDL